MNRQAGCLGRWERQHCQHSQGYTDEQRWEVQSLAYEGSMLPDFRDIETRQPTVTSTDPVTF